MSKATAILFIDKKHPKADGSCAVSLRITYNRKIKYFKLGYSYSLLDFEKIMAQKPRGSFKDAKRELMEVLIRADTCINALPVFTFNLFERAFLLNADAIDTIKAAFDEKIDQLNVQGRPGTADNYQCAINSIEGFKKGMKFADITPTVLAQYEKAMRNKATNNKRGLSATTIGMYLRPLRAIFNDKIAIGSIDPKIYPFGKRKYEIPTGKSRKMALDVSEIKKILDYDCLPGSFLERSRDFFIFSYFSNGINFKDLLSLKYSNLHDDRIIFVREKTKLTKRNEVEITIYLNDITVAIIKRWQRISINKDAYLFPFLTGSMDVREIKKTVQQFIHVTNDNLKEIRKELGISMDVTTYTARHSAATQLMRSGAPVAFISKALGHSDIKTTQSYLDSFEDDAAKKMMGNLMPMKTTKTIKNG